MKFSEKTGQSFNKYQSGNNSCDESDECEEVAKHHSAVAEFLDNVVVHRGCIWIVVAVCVCHPSGSLRVLPAQILAEHSFVRT